SVRRALVLAALVNGATFATFAYLGVIATGVLPAGAVPGLLAAFGGGAFLGVTAAGRLGGGWLVVGGVCALPLGWAALALAATHAVPLFVLAVVLGGLSFGVGSTLVGRVMHVAAHAPSLSGAFATVALNVGAFAGPLLAGAVTGTTGDYRDAAWVSAGLAATAIVLVARRTRD
ncbi:Cmx/CmrA family chloramphenicol efflux MFS transporter, partial [Saccharothrix hoggarensis]